MDRQRRSLLLHQSFHCRLLICEECFEANEKSVLARWASHDMLLAEVRPCQTDLLCPRCVRVKTTNHKVEIEILQRSHLLVFGTPVPLGCGAETRGEAADEFDFSSLRLAESANDPR